MSAQGHCFFTCWVKRELGYSTEILNTAIPWTFLRTSENVNKKRTYRRKKSQTLLKIFILSVCINEYIILSTVLKVEYYSLLSKLRLYFDVRRNVK